MYYLVLYFHFHIQYVRYVRYVRMLTNLMEAVRGQEKTRLISPKNLPSVMVAKTTLPSSLTTSTVPLLMKNIWKEGEGGKRQI